jgi:hypothetical protein
VIDGTSCIGAALHRNLLQWDASNLDSPDGFLAYRTRGLTVNVNSAITTLTAAALPPSATSYEDGEELPNGVDFTYWTKAVFDGEQPTAPSIFARVTAVNVAPTATDNSYTGTGVVTGNVFTDGAPDSDPDFGPNGRTLWTALLVDSLGVPVATPPAGLTFPGDGTFSYNMANGSITFYYRIDTGEWTDGKTKADMSLDSNVAKVTIALPPSADTTGPTFDQLAVTPLVIWSPNGKKVTVTVSGKVTDLGSGIASVLLTVADEYGLDQPAPRLLTPGAGLTCTSGAQSCSLSVTYQLTASRKGGDKDGRTYTITAVAKDVVGNTTVGPTLSVTAHDQSK